MVYTPLMINFNGHDGMDRLLADCRGKCFLEIKAVLLLASVGNYSGFVFRWDRNCFQFDFE